MVIQQGKEGSAGRENERGNFLLTYTGRMENQAISYL